MGRHDHKGARATGGNGWKRAACWVLAAGTFFAAAASIHPSRSPGGDLGPELDRLVSDPMRPGVDGLVDSGALSASEDQVLGTLEGFDTTVWFYAGVAGPTASVLSASGPSLERVSMEELHRLAPELRLDSATALMGDVPVPADGWHWDW